MICFDFAQRVYTPARLQTLSVEFVDYKNMFKNIYLRFICGVTLWFPLCALAQFAFVLNSNDDTLSLIDTKTYKEVSRTRVGREPHHWAITPDDKSLIIGSVQSNDLTFLDPVTGAFQKRIDKISDPYQIGFSPDKKWFVSASLALDRVDIYSATDYKLVKRIATPREDYAATLRALADRFGRRRWRPVGARRWARCAWTCRRSRPPPCTTAKGRRSAPIGRRWTAGRPRWPPPPWWGRGSRIARSCWTERASTSAGTGA